MSRLICLITCGQTGEGPDPGLTPLGEYQARQLITNLPFNQKVVFCGTGSRHLRTTEILGLKPRLYSGFIGTPESKKPGKPVIVLANGTEIPKNMYTPIDNQCEAFLGLIGNLPNHGFVITDQSMIDIPDLKGSPKAGAVYTYSLGRGVIEELFVAPDDIGGGA